MKIYLVGGALRNELLGLTVAEKDWVVVGSSPEELLTQGFTQVGKSFPVFLHPVSKEEYALARTEQKTSPGYTGFAIHATPDVTLEEDLLRRDLTINAIARDTDNTIIDPFGGQADINARLLRHVSPAFSEDPVRVLRTARFCAQLGQFDFRIADETMRLMQQMVSDGEVDALIPERIWKETLKALESPYPRRYFESLRECGALEKLFPEINSLYGVPQPAHFHPEIDSGLHTMMVLEQATKLSLDPEVRFAALVHDLGKGTTPKAILPSHREHEIRGVPLVNDLCDRLRVPNNFRSLALVVTKYHLYYHRAAELRATTFVKLFDALDGFRRPTRVAQFLLACEADSRGRTGYENRDCEQTDIFQRAFNAALDVKAKPLIEKGLTGEAVKAALRELRTKAVSQSITH